MGKFFPEIEQWDIYVERFQNYFVANDIGAEAKKHAIPQCLWSYHISVN